MTDKIVVFSTSPSAEEADRLASALLDKRLAACITVLPGARSIYRWEGKVERSQEFLLIIKSSRGHFDRLSAELTRCHSYEVPEAIAIPIIDGSRAYLDWMGGELTHELTREPTTGEAVI